MSQEAADKMRMINFSFPFLNWFMKTKQMKMMYLYLVKRISFVAYISSFIFLIIMLSMKFIMYLMIRFLIQYTHQLGLLHFYILCLMYSIRWIKSKLTYEFHSKFWQYCVSFDMC